MKTIHRDPLKLYPHDRVMAVLILPLIPKFVTPNQVTVVRFLLTPFAIWGLAIGAYSWAIPFFVFVAFTDMIDGSLARVRKQVTEWGSVFDPVADKILISLASVVVVSVSVGWWLTLLLIFFELAIATGGALQKNGGRILTANYWGKSKMMAQSVGIFLLLLGMAMSFPLLITLGTIVLMLAVVLAILSLFTYSI